MSLFGRLVILNSIGLVAISMLCYYITKENTGRPVSVTSGRTQRVLVGNDEQKHTVSERDVMILAQNYVANHGFTCNSQWYKADYLNDEKEWFVTVRKIYPPDQAGFLGFSQGAIVLEYSDTGKLLARH